MSKFPVSFKKVKGEGWEEKDNLHEIKGGVDKLTGDSVVAGVIAVDTTVPGEKTYLSLDIVNAAELSADGKKILVMGDCYIRSGRIVAGSLEVYGDLVVEQAVGDSSYVNMVDVDELIVHGDAIIKNADWPAAIAGNLQKFGGDLTIEDLDSYFDGAQTVAGNSPAASPRGYRIHVKGNLHSGMTGLVGKGAGLNANSAGYRGLGFIIKVDGDISMPDLASINTAGGSNASNYAYASGGGAGQIALSAGGNLTIGASAALSACGGDTVGSAAGGAGNDIDVHYGGALTGTIASTDVAGGVSTNGTDGADGTYTTANSIMDGHIPAAPSPTTIDGAEVSALNFDVPSDANGSNLDFRVEIQEMLSVVIWLPVIDQNSNDNSGQFSGSVPFTQGTGSVVYTIPSGLVSGKVYRWRVTAMKDTDTTLTSIPSKWREFIMA